MKNKLTRVVLLAMISAVFFSCTKEMNEVETQQETLQGKTEMPAFDAGNKSDVMFNLSMKKSGIQGYRNIALNRGCAVSDQKIGYPYYFINDGDDETFWVSEGGNGYDWVCIDLGAVSEFAGIRLLWSDLFTIGAYQIYLSNDFKNWINTGEINSEFHEQILLMSENSVKARYVGILCLKETEESSGIREFEVLQKGNFVEFPDPNLEAKIRLAINIPEGKISEMDLLNLTKLECKESGIIDLTGLEYCYNLEFLSISDNSITDLSPLSGLDLLYGLEIDNMGVSDISVLQNLNNLVYISAMSNQIKDIGPLQNLTSMNSLLLSDNLIEDLTPLYDLLKMQFLDIQNNNMLIKEDLGQGSVNLNIVNKHLSNECWVEWEKGNIID